jgi:hypothetical protein
MTDNVYLEPQVFHPKSVTQLPAIDFYEYGYNQLPSIYRQAPNFLALLKVISDRKQYIYDIARSFVNVFNLNNTDGNPTYPAFPQGVYLDLLATAFNAQYNALALSTSTYNAIQNTVSYINARGRIKDFEVYFRNNGLGDYFNNDHIFLDPNATLVFSVPIPNTPLNLPNPYAIFTTSMSLLKGMGVRIETVGANIPLFQFGAPPGNQVAPGNAGFGVLLLNGEVINGGFFSTTIQDVGD